ncbi:hypothetical protein BH09VER1_BH09VER1_34650 [soil metagenome]
MTALKYIKTVVGFLLLLTVPRSTSAQGSAPEQLVLPEGALLKPAPEFSRWTIDYSYPHDHQDATKGPAVALDPALPRTTTTTKTKQIIHEETVTVSGKKTESWQRNEDFYTWIPERKLWAAYEKPTQSQIDSGIAVIMTAPKNGFRGLDWIGVKSYVGFLKTKEQTFLVFVPNAPNFDVNNAKALQAQPNIGYVDGDSRLPIRVTENNVVRTYRFEKIPETMQKIPDDLLAEIKQGDEIRAKFNAAPSREY